MTKQSHQPSHPKQINTPATTTLRLATFNIQTGIRTTRYHHYLTKSWQHLLPTPWRKPTLTSIATELRHFDIVGLQEVDGGGSRSDYVIQTEFLAHRAGFDYWYHQVNRRIGNMALQCNGLLSRITPHKITEHKLPGLPGRGVLLAQYGENSDALNVCILHLALGKRARLRQIDFISDLVADLPQLAIMGDFNCEPRSVEMQRLFSRTRLYDPAEELTTFPSWQPRKKIDYILVTPELSVDHVQVLDFPCSDHLPITMDIAFENKQAAAA